MQGSENKYFRRDLRCKLVLQSIIFKKIGFGEEFVAIDSIPKKKYPVAIPFHNSTICTSVPSLISMPIFLNNY